MVSPNFLLVSPTTPIPQGDSLIVAIRKKLTPLILRYMCLDRNSRTHKPGNTFPMLSGSNCLSSKTSAQLTRARIHYRHTKLLRRLIGRLHYCVNYCTNLHYMERLPDEPATF